MMKIQVFEWLKYDGCKVLIDNSIPHIVRLQQDTSISEIIMKTSEGEIHLKPKGTQTALIYGNTIRYDESMENKL